MTISRKGSYPIDVNGVTYRWSVSPRPAFDQELASVLIEKFVELFASMQVHRVP